jgi:hypothetical protein
MTTPEPITLPVAPAPAKPCGCKDEIDLLVPSVTRPSCLECVEKHLGAAWVLLSERRDGYGHRLYAIGHLFEAEDESQAWPDLHYAIREARRTYQQTGKVPDFDALAAVIAGHRPAG